MSLVLTARTTFYFYGGELLRRKGYVFRCWNNVFAVTIKAEAGGRQVITVAQLYTKIII